jgi:hypothetical protein
MNNTKFLVILLATNNYINYVPYYIYSTLFFNKIHDIDFLIFVSNDKKTLLDKLISLLPEVNIKVEEINNDIGNQRLKNNQPYILFHRFILSPNYYESYDYVHIPDVDALIYEDIFSKRVEYMKKVSYCNKLRKMYKRYNGIYRFYGCAHTFKVKEYLNNYQNIIDNYQNNINSIDELNIIDEQFLYYLVKDNKKEVSYIKNIPPDFDLIGGFHLGLFKKGERYSEIEKYISPNNLSNIIILLEDKLFIAIHEIYKNNYINLMYKFINEVYKYPNL